MCFFSIAKYLLWAFNFALWLGGLAVLGIGIYLIVGDGSQFVELGDVNFYAASTPELGGSIFIIAGSCAFILGFIGCKGSKNENTCMLGLYFISLLVLLVLQVGLGIWAVCNFDSVDEVVASGINEQTLTEDSSSFINMEQTMKCCGQSKGCQDWVNANQSEPFGCECTSGQSGCVPIRSSGCGSSFVPVPDKYNYIYNTTCTKAMTELVHENMKLIAGIGLGIGLFEIFGMIIACCMYQAIKEHKGMWPNEGFMNTQPFVFHQAYSSDKHYLLAHI